MKVPCSVNGEEAIATDVCGHFDSGLLAAAPNAHHEDIAAIRAKCTAGSYDMRNDLIKENHL